MFIIENCNDLQKPIILKEVGSCLNDKRKKYRNLYEWSKIMKSIEYLLPIVTV